MLVHEQVLERLFILEQEAQVLLSTIKALKQGWENDIPKKPQEKQLESTQSLQNTLNARMQSIQDNIDKII